MIKSKILVQLLQMILTFEFSGTTMVMVVIERGFICELDGEVIELYR